MGTTLDITKTQKNGSRIWFGLSIPATGSYLTIGADGVPDATENPSAKLIGFTEAGARLKLTRQITEEFYDEIKQAVDTTIEQTGGSIAAEAGQVLDVDLLSLATVGIGTPLTPTGKKAWSLGESALTYTSIAAIAPTKADPTKFVVFHLYKAHNIADFDMALSRTERSKIPLEFAAKAIATRPLADTVGMLYITT
jgi:hypothetical protein